MEQKQSNESLVRERDFYRSKFEGMEKKIKNLTTDCAYLKKDNDGLRDRLKEMNKQALLKTEETLGDRCGTEIYIYKNKWSKEDFDSEERVEVEVVMEDNDLGQLEEKFSNFLKGCGYENISVSITEPRIEEDSDHLGDLDDELEDIDEVDNIRLKKNYVQWWFW